MRSRLTSSTAAQSPVTVPELKSYARIDHSESDGDLDTILAAVTERVEELTRLALVQRTFTQTIQNAPSAIDLARAPVISVASVTDDGETLTEGEDQDYVVNGAKLYLASRPDGELVVTYDAGLASTASDVPASLRKQVLRYAATAYEQPTSLVTGTIITPVPPAVQDALTQHMRVRA